MPRSLEQSTAASVFDIPTTHEILSASGCLDFVSLTDGQLLSWLSTLGAWPGRMPLTVDLPSLGLTEEDLDAATTSAKRSADLRRRRRTELTFGDRSFDTSTDELRELIDAVADSVTEDFPHAPATPVRLESLAPLTPVGGHRNLPTGGHLLLPTDGHLNAESDQSGTNVIVADRHIGDAAVGADRERYGTVGRARNTAYACDSEVFGAHVLIAVTWGGRGSVLRLQCDRNATALAHVGRRCEAGHCPGGVCVSEMASRLAPGASITPVTGPTSGSGPNGGCSRPVPGGSRA